MYQVSLETQVDSAQKEVVIVLESTWCAYTLPLSLKPDKSRAARNHPPHASCTAASAGISGQVKRLQCPQMCAYTLPKY